MHIINNKQVDLFYYGNKMLSINKTNSSQLPSTPSPSQLYLGPGDTTLPGITNIYYSIFNGYKSYQALQAAKKIDDREGIVENALRALQAPFGASNGVMQLFFNSLQVGKYLKIFNHPKIPIILYTTSPLALLIAVTGFILCAIEGALEGLGLSNTYRFFKKIHPFDMEEIKKNTGNSLSTENFNFSNTLLSQLKRINGKYFEISEKGIYKINNYTHQHLADLPEQERNRRQKQIISAQLKRGKAKFARRVHPRLAQQVEKELPHLIQDLQSSAPSQRKKAELRAENLFTDIKIQCDKKFLIHTLGLLAVLFTLAGLIAGFVACPIAVPFVLIIIGSALAIVRGLIHRGSMDLERWDFSIYPCIPQPLKDFYYWIKSRNENPEMIPLQNL